MKVLVIGSKGKMGSLVKSILASDPRISQVYGYDKQEDLTNHTFHSFSNLPTCDVVIDYSNPSLLTDILQYALNNKTPLVIATTGYSEEDEKKIVLASQSVAIFKSANYSFGVEVVTQVLKSISSVLVDDYDIEIIEKHHHMKVDAPSGTSLHLAKTMNDAIDAKKEVVNGHQGKRNPNTLAIHAVRGGSVVGEHTVTFFGQDETIEISHIAQSKSIFAHGSIKAAKFIIGKTPGLYKMSDLFKELSV